MSDYISRESAKDNVSQFLSTHAFVILPELRKSFDKIPSADVRENIHGEWMIQPSNKEQGERDFIWWKCSKCGQVIYSETEKDRKEFHAFCGRCGADMRGKA